jgi:hypothetical protein
MVTSNAKQLAALVLGLAFVPACDQGDTVGPEGGIVVSRDGRVTLEIPEGALSEDLAITIEVVDEGPEGAVGRTYEIEPRFTQLQFPARLTYDLAVEDGVSPLGLAGADMSGASLVTEKADGWGPLADREIDLAAQEVSASVMFFSSYALVLAK